MAAPRIHAAKFRLKHPEIIIMFEELIERRGVRNFFQSLGYRQVESFFNSHFIDDDRKSGNVLLMKSTHFAV
jgi:hypothetical protein